MKRSLVWAACVLLGIASLPLVSSYKQYGSFSQAFAIAQPYIITPQPGVSGSAATTTQFFGNVDPQTSGQYNLGDSGQAWKNIYASGTASLNSIVIGSGGCTGCGASLNPFTGDIVPAVNNAQNVGASTSSLKNIYVSSTAFIGTIATTTFSGPLTDNWTASNQSLTLSNPGLGGNNILNITSGNDSVPQTSASVVIRQDTAGNAGDYLNIQNSDFGVPVLKLGIEGSGGSGRIIFRPGNDIGASTGDIEPDGSSFLSGSLAVGKTSGASTQFEVNGVSQFDGTVQPDTNNSRDIGSTTKAFANIYASGTADIAKIAAVSPLDIKQNSSTTPGSIQYSFYNSTHTGNSFGDQSGMYYDPFFDELDFSVDNLRTVQLVGSGGSMSVYGSIFPFDSGKTNPLNANNEYDLGTFGQAWRNIYSSSTYFGVAENLSGTQVVMTGLGANVATDNFVCVSATGTLRTETANCTVSSARFKQNIDSLSPDKMLEEVKKLRAVSFDWKDGYIPNGGTNGGGQQSTGFIAEEVAAIDPQLVAYEDANVEDIAWEKAHYPDAILYKNGKTLIPKTVDYARVSYVLAGAIQAEDARITKLEQRVGTVERLIRWIESFFKK